MAERQAGTKVSWLKIILFTVLASFIGFIAYFIAKFYFSFYSLDENVYAQFAYNWKKNEAFSTLEKPWAPLKKHTWDEKNKKINDFVKDVQGGPQGIITKLDDKELLLDFFPEHFPRYPQIMYYTVNFPWNKEVFLPFRKMMVKLSFEHDVKNKDAIWKFLDQNKSYLNKEKGATKSTPPVLIWDLEKIRLRDYDYSSEPFQPKIDDTRRALYKLLTYINISCPKNEKILNNTDPENNKIVDLTFDLFNTMDIEHRVQKGDKQIGTPLEKRHCLEFWKNLGTACSTPFESFIYTRLFYIFYFHTTAIPRIEIEDKKNKGQKKKEEPKDVYRNRHTDFAALMVKAFKDPQDCEKPNFLKGFFRPHLKEKTWSLDDKKVHEYLDALSVA